MVSGGGRVHCNNGLYKTTGKPYGARFFIDNGIIMGCGGGTLCRRRSRERRRVTTVVRSSS